LRRCAAPAGGQVFARDELFRLKSSKKKLKGLKKMFLNYLKIALRNIKRHKSYSFINISGLAIGMASFLLIMMWVMDELSYDRFHKNADHLFRIEQDQKYSGSVYHVNVTPYPMAEGVKAEIPEVKYATPYPWVGTLLLRHGENSFFESGVRAVSKDLLHMFSFPLTRGDKTTVLNDPFSIVITEEMAEKYFGDKDPVGQMITINNRFDFTVTGILKNLPTNSVVRFDMLVPFEFLKDLGRTIDQWGWNSIVTYVQLHENVDIKSVNQKITDLRFRKTEELLKDDPERLKRHREGEKTDFMLMPLTDIHLHAYFGYTRSMGDIIYVYIVSIIAIFILLIACINFMNLSTARSANRAKEVGLRKVVGAKKQNLIGQFYGESILMAFLGLILALILISLLLPGFSTLADKDFTINTILQPEFIIGMLAVTLLTGIISGSYPAMFLSAFQPVKILRGGGSGSSKGVLFRKVLVVFQFSISLILIVGTILVYNQVHFMKEKELGYDKEHLIYIPLRGDTKKFYDVLKHELIKDDKVLNVTGTNSPPSRIGSNTSGVDWDGKDPNLRLLVSFAAVNFDYTETMKIELVEGRSFSKSFTTDTANAYMINEELVKIMGKKSVVNERFSMGKEGIVIGVMKNYHFQSVSEHIEPLAISVNPSRTNYLVIRLNAGDIPAGIEYVKSTWERIVTNYPFDHRFVDEDINRMYSGWNRLSSLLRYFAFLAIFIACLGLFGLASFTAEQRTKEIGVRKVLGASISNIVILMSRDFTKWILIANLIAWPISYYLINNWLKDFAYRISIGIDTFIFAAVMVLVIAFLTVFYQSLKAATANPVDSIKYE
jgi:ABC-type antimicrobial peptide transport system permease subunit